MRIGIVILFQFVCLVGSAQSFNKDMQKLRESYDNNYISMDVTYNMYNTLTSSQPAETQKMWMEAGNNKLHYKGQGEEVIYTDKNVLMVSHEDKEITLDTVTPNFNQPNNQILPLDTVSNHMKSITFQDLGNNQIKYTLIPKNQDEFSKIVYFINTKTWLLEKIELYPGEELGGGKVFISYSQMVKLAVAPNNSFSFKPFLQIKQGGSYSLTQTYSTYKFYHRDNYKN